MNYKVLMNMMKFLKSSIDDIHLSLRFELREDKFVFVPSYYKDYFIVRDENFILTDDMSFDKILFEMIDAISRVYDQHGISFSMKEEDMNKILGDLYGRD